VVERRLELHGPRGLGAKPLPELIGPVLARLHGTLISTVRMGFLHSSRTRGRIPKALHRAAQARFLGHAAGPDDCTSLRFEVAEFGTVAGELFQQGQLWDTGPRPEQSAFDLLAASLQDVRQMARDSERFDHALLRRFAGYRRVLRKGLSWIGLPDVPGREERIDEQLSAAAESLLRETPPARRVRLCGRLDLLRVSKRVLGLLIEDGTPVTAVWTADGFVDLATFLDKQVLIEGLAEFRPSGSLLRVDADAIREATAADAVFSVIPLPEARRDYQREALAVRRGQMPYASLFGLISGDESDEEFGAAVEEMS
jgi:hypothetical protein